jgi:putative ABC transport system ATP-binding protein
MSFIEARHLVKTYGVGEQLVHALNDVTLEIQRGEFVAIVGASGSGKSTFMNMIGCLDQPTTGSCLIAGEDIATLDSNALANLRNRRIGFVFQQFNLLARTSALENVALPLLYAREGDLAGLTKQDRLEHAKKRLEQVGLGERLSNTPAQLSGGQQQRVAIARALVNDPDLILADEPTGALDSKTSAEVMDLLTHLNQQGITVVVVTHEQDVAAYANRTITFKDGRVLSDQKNPLKTLQGDNSL